ncbi:MAG: methionyl-tRNA formyltransferase [Clostridia bacterium]|nr:methionyl-tRNA formyltransferase [Clostridia bacterium]
MRILFMGTPDFALFSLRALVESGENVIGVITQPDKPRGRGYELQPPPVKKYALASGLPVYQPTTLKGDDFAALLAAVDPELIIVVAFGKILPRSVLDYPKYGCINVHGSLLPEYRGAAPMQRAIIDGCTMTGVTTMYMADGIDTGDMLLKAETPICDEDNFETIHDRLGEMGAKTLLDTIALLKKGALIPQKQDDTLATHAAKIEKADCHLNFSDTTRALHCRIRGLSPIPVAFTHTPDGKLLKVLAATPSALARPKDAKNGEIISLEDGVITVACADGTLALTRVTPEGKRAMPAADYIRGRNISIGDILG